MMERLAVVFIVSTRPGWFYDRGGTRTYRRHGGLRAVRSEGGNCAQVHRFMRGHARVEELAGVESVEWRAGDGNVHR